MYLRSKWLALWIVLGLIAMVGPEVRQALANGAVAPGIAIDEKANNSTVELAPGQTVQMTLHSTYWRVEGSSAPAVVEQTGEPALRAAPPGACRPGMGCGEVTAVFVARRAGTARISASRSVCGEALACRPDQRTFVVSVVVR